SSFVYNLIQAEDGILDFHVNGVQTCAIPISQASTTNAGLLREARRRGMVESEVHFLRFLAATELRTGHCGRALDLARESLRLARDSGIGEGASALLASLAEASGGDVRSAERRVGREVSL